MTEPASAQEPFRGRHFDQEIIVLCVRWYLTFKLSSRDLVQFLRQSRTLIIRLFVSEIMAPKERSKAREFNKQATARTATTETSGRPIPHLSYVLLSLAAAIFSVGLKFAAYLLTGSMGLFSDALESIANVVGALGALFALWYAARPPDRTHPYGHQKIEFFASGIEGGLILLAALFICYSSVARLFHPVMREALGFGMGLVVVSTTANLFVGYTLLRIGRRVDSIVLEADRRHLL